VSLNTGPAVVVGGGPAGLACAIELRTRGVAEVLVLEREAQAGGIPRHCAHPGFGARDLRRFMSGPRYARHYAALARRAGARVDQETMVTGWASDGTLELTGPSGRNELAPSVVVLATGCRERPRAARLVAGSRPAGVMTTGMLQQLVELRGKRLSGRALVVGAEHVSFSALLTLSRAGAEVVGMVTPLSHHQSLMGARTAAAVRYRTPLWTRTALSSIHGHPTVEGVELEHLDSGRARRLGCEIVVFTADWIPDHELAVMGALELDPATRGPRVDTGLRTARVGVFAAGNVIHPAEPGDVAALSGRRAAASAAAWLSEPDLWPAPAVPLVCRAPLHWISPNAVGPARDEPPRGRFALRSTTFLRRPAIEIAQGGRRLWRGRVTRLTPGRSTSLPRDWVTSVDPAGGVVEVMVVAGSRAGLTLH
jgi:thioredoxin reductase